MSMKIYDCIIIGAGPGGLQAAIYLGRYNREVLLLDRGGGRTWHARQIENFITQKAISGKEIIDIGMKQAQSFNVRIKKAEVTRVLKRDYFEVSTGDEKFISKFIIVSSGVYEKLPKLENLHKFFGTSFFTCVDCDGYNTTGKKLAVIGNSIEAVHLAFAVREMFTNDVALVLEGYRVPPGYETELKDEEITLIIGRPTKIIGDENMVAVELEGGRKIECEVILASYGYRLNDDFLSDIELKKDREGFYFANQNFESSLQGLYIVGPLNTGNDQVVISAGEGAAAAIDINKRLLNI
ncbi:MAG: NAD(P)/FAD-dependent oxidoreductase [Candidatus Hydrothermarchaeaceae archaeon]